MAAATSVQNDRETCPGCGLRPDQHGSVEAILDRCPGCESKQILAKSIKKGEHGLRAVFDRVTDSRDSIWAKYTLKGARWNFAHRRDPGVLLVKDPAELD